MGLKYAIKTSALALVGLDILERPREILSMVADAGFDAIDVLGDPDRISSKLASEIARTAASFGLGVSAVGGAWAAWQVGEERDLASSDETARALAVGYARRCVDLALSLGSPVFQLCAAPARLQYPFSSVPIETLRRSFVRSTREICHYAMQRNINIAIEPINRYEGHPGFLNTVAGTLSVIEEVAARNLGILVDLFHANIEDPSICGALRMAGDKLMDVHLSDSNRHVPGTGHIDFVRVIRTLDEMRYDGYMALGILPTVHDVDTMREGLLERSLSYMKELEHALALQKSVYAGAAG
jgi:D-psicose/D-tagatose/L-ribulose 3-epimerase